MKKLSKGTPSAANQGKQDLIQFVPYQSPQNDEQKLVWQFFHCPAKMKYVMSSRKTS